MIDHNEKSVKSNVEEIGDVITLALDGSFSIFKGFLVITPHLTLTDLHQMNYE